MTANILADIPVMTKMKLLPTSLPVMFESNSEAPAGPNKNA